VLLLTQADPLSPAQRAQETHTYGAGC
jgi:hypothetical protein